MYAAAIRSPQTLIAAVLTSAFVVLLAAPAEAQSADQRFAADRYEPSERGSEWFANESLRLFGPTAFRAGVVSSYGERLYVVRNASGDVLASPLRNDEVLHVGASLTLMGFLRLGANVPVHLLQSGRTYGALRSPRREQGAGDLRLGADVRVYGRDEGPFRLALGAQFWVPVGEKVQWASDGTARIRPRVLVAGEKGIFLWSAQANLTFRDDRIGSDIGLAGALGVRLLEQVTIGPEFFTSTNVTDGAFTKTTTPFELMIGSHWLIARTVRIGVGLGRGFTQSTTDPNYRVLGMLEYAPEPKPERRRPPPPPPAPPPPKPVAADSDHDGVPDDRDGCPSIAGIVATDDSQNGCPPDTDGDGINDIGDACPTQPGPATYDWMTTGCPAAAP
jgi:OOP family OmpA-OmpF porin